MTRTTNSGYGIVRLQDRQGPVGLTEKGIVIATSEARIAGWLGELVLPCAGRQYTLRHAATQSIFATLVQMPRVAMAFIEIGFFGEAMIGSLEKLRKQYPRLWVVLFTVSGTVVEDTARYLCWGGGSFVSLRDRPEDVLRGMRDYEGLPLIEPHLTR